MKFTSKKPKPPTGLEMTVTLSMPAEQTPQQQADALVKFFDAVHVASLATQAIWVSIKCRNISEEFEGVLQGAIDKLERRPKLTLVVDNGDAADKA